MRCGAIEQWAKTDKEEEWKKKKKQEIHRAYVWRKYVFYNTFCFPSFSFFFISIWTDGKLLVLSHPCNSRLVHRNLSVSSTRLIRKRKIWAPILRLVPSLPMGHNVLYAEYAPFGTDEFDECSNLCFASSCVWFTRFLVLSLKDIFGGTGIRTKQWLICACVQHAHSRTTFISQKRLVVSGCLL